MKKTPRRPRRSLQAAWQILRRRDGGLARRGDRIEAAVRLVTYPVIIALLAGSISLALLTLHAGRVQERVDQQTMRRIEATVLEARNLAAGSPAAPTLTQAWDVRLRWSSSGGTPRTGEVVALAPDKPEGTMAVWRDRHGRLWQSIWRSQDSEARAVMTGLGGMFIATVLLAIVTHALRLLLIHRHLAQWQREWQRIGPVWMHR